MPTINSSHYVKKYDQAIKDHDNEKLGALLIKGLGKKISIKILEKLAHKRNAKELLHAIEVAKKMHNLNNAASVQELVVACFYAATQLQKHIDKKEYYLTRKMTKLPLKLEYDPETERTFIHTAKKISEGMLKEVFISYEYDEKPRVIANGEANGNGGRESENYKIFNGVPGIIQARAVTRRKENGKQKVSFLTDFFQPGALNDKIFKQLTFKQKFTVAKDILTGLSEIHKKGYIHRDLKPANIFINKKGDEVQGILGDLGQTKVLKDARGERPNASHLYNPPEVYKSDLKSIDYQKAEIFSAGCVFYEMLFKKPPTWLNSKYFPKALLGLAQGQKKVMKRSSKKAVKIVRSEMKKDIKKKSKNPTEKKLKELISSMLNEKPEKRPTAAAALQML
jgi:serine/threonine protein kinase